MKKTEIATIISAGSSAVLAITVLIQVGMLQTEFSSTNRPWIGIVDFDVNNNLFNIVYKNYGKIPSDSGTLKLGVSHVLVPEFVEALPEIPESIDVGSVLPDQTKTQFFPSITKKIIDSQNGEPLYIGILFNYEYLDGKKGEYGLVLLYVDSKFSIEKNWSK